MGLDERPDPSRRIRVAVVDDHRLVLDGITASLRTSPELQVVISEQGWGGLLAHPEFPVDVVVLDLNLEDQIGIGVKLRALAAAGSRVIVMSRHSDSVSIYNAIRAGARGFVPKTESTTELVRAIMCAADDRQYNNRPLTEAIASVTSAPHPRLGEQERRALVLYGAGRSVKEVATLMGTTEDTVKSYVKRARRKYRAVGVDVGTKVLLRRRGIVEGWLTAE